MPKNPTRLHATLQERAVSQLQGQARPKDGDERSVCECGPTLRYLRAVFSRRENMFLVSGPRRVRSVWMPHVSGTGQEGEARRENVRGVFPRLSRQVPLAKVGEPDTPCIVGEGVIFRPCFRTSRPPSICPSNFGTFLRLL